MKIAGQQVKGRNRVVIAIPRPESNLIFIAEAVSGYDVFDKMVKEPTPPAKVKPDRSKVYDFKDKGYLAQLGRYNKQRIAWLILESLKGTPDLEWETVDPANPESWPNWETELRDADLNQFEINRVLNGVFEANCLNEALVAAARDSFVRGQETASDESSGPSTEAVNTPNGVPAVG